MPRVLLLFVDGVGLGDDTAFNPFTAAALPTLHAVLGIERVVARAVPCHSVNASLVGVDATLGMPGLPQSGTGQATLLTGVDAITLHGRHFGPWVPAHLRPLVREESVLARAQRAGRSIAFANAYPEEVLQQANGDAAITPATPERRRMPFYLRAGPPLAALGAGVLTRHTPALAVGDAVASEITNDGWRERLGRHEVPVIDAVAAGHNLARIVAAHDLTMFAHYATDNAGHTCDSATAVQSLERLDAFLGGLLDAVPEDALVVMVSDHGNIEDLRRGHTRNPAIALVAGGGHELFARRLHSLADITPAILDLLSLGSG